MLSTRDGSPRTMFVDITDIKVFKTPAEVLAVATWINLFLFAVMSTILWSRHTK